MARIVRTASFLAKDDMGNRYQINEFTEMVDFCNTKGISHSPGWKSLRTDDGQEVNYLGRGRYKLVFPEIELTSDDPAAV